MAISVICSKCGTRAEVADSVAGAKGKCRVCGGIVHVPGTAKFCHGCGMGVAGRKRGKDHDGNYYCEPCWSAKGAADSMHDPFSAAAAEAHSEQQTTSAHRVSTESLPLIACVMCGGQFIYSYLRNVEGRAICIECDDARRAGSPANKSRPAAAGRTTGSMGRTANAWRVLVAVGVVGVVVGSVVVLRLNSSGHRSPPLSDAQIAAASGMPDSGQRGVDAAAGRAEAAKVAGQEADELRRQQEAKAVEETEYATKRKCWASAQGKLESYYSSAFVRVLRDLSSLEEAGKPNPQQSDGRWLSAFIAAYIVVLQDEKDRLVHMPTMTDQEKSALGETLNELATCDAALATRLKCSGNFHKLAIAILTDAVNGKWAGKEGQAASLIAELERDAVAYHRDAERQHAASVSQLNKSELRGWTARINAEGLSVDDVAIAAAATETIRSVQARAQIAITQQQPNVADTTPAAPPTATGTPNVDTPVSDEEARKVRDHWVSQLEAKTVQGRKDIVRMRLNSPERNQLADSIRAWTERKAELGKMDVPAIQTEIAANRKREADEASAEAERQRTEAAQVAERQRTEAARLAAVRQAKFPGWNGPWKICPVCGGTGRDEIAEREANDHNASIHAAQTIGTGMKGWAGFSLARIACDLCGGTGRVPDYNR
jgi:hypothetical protein